MLDDSVGTVRGVRRHELLRLVNAHTGDPTAEGATFVLTEVIRELALGDIDALRKEGKRQTAIGKSTITAPLGDGRFDMLYLHIVKCGYRLIICSFQIIFYSITFSLFGVDFVQSTHGALHLETDTDIADGEVEKQRHHDDAHNRHEERLKQQKRNGNAGAEKQERTGLDIVDEVVNGNGVFTFQHALDAVEFSQLHYHAKHKANEVYRHEDVKIANRKVQTAAMEITANDTAGDNEPESQSRQNIHTTQFTLQHIEDGERKGVGGEGIERQIEGRTHIVALLTEMKDSLQQVVDGEGREESKEQPARPLIDLVGIRGVLPADHQRERRCRAQRHENDLKSFNGNSCLHKSITTVQS